MKPATEKQLELIDRIEYLLKVRFTGQTVKEASEFITEHLPTYNDELSCLINNEDHY